MNSVRERLLRILIDRLRAALAPAPVLRQPAAGPCSASRQQVVRQPDADNPEG